MSANVPPPSPQPPLLVVRVVGGDRWRVVTNIALVGLALAGLLAVFGMPPVDLHGPNHRLGIMVPTCGMTRGVAAAARLDLATAVSFNPAAPFLVAGAVAALLRAVVGRVSGRWIDVMTGVPRFWMWVSGVAFVALWVNQQAHASLLMGP